MTDAVLTSNRQSFVQASLDKKAHTALHYGLRQNYPNLSRNKLIVSPNNQPASNVAGAEIVFNIPRTGIYTDMVLETNLTMATTTATAAFNAGLQIFENQQWIARGRVLCEFSDAYTVCRVDKEVDPAKQLSMIYASRFQFANDVSAIKNVTSATCYTPIHATWLDGTIQSGIDSSFVENLQLRLVYNRTARSGIFQASGSPGYVSACTNRLFCSYVNMETEEMAKFRAINYDPSRPFQMLMESSITEGPILMLAGDQNIDLKVNAFVFQTDIYIRNNAEAGLAAIPNDQTSTGYVDSYSLKVASREVFRNYPYRLLIQDKEKQGSLGLTLAGVNPAGSSGYYTVSRKTIRPITFYYGMNSSRGGCSGGLAISSKNNCQITLTSTVSPSTTTDVYLVHSTWNLLQIANDGTADVVLSS